MDAFFLSHVFGTKKFFNKLVEVIGFVGNEKLAGRLMEMGLLPGSHLTVLGQSPFNGPIMIQAGAAIFCLRKEEAQCIQIAIK